jgi:hypothetical protein
MSEAYDKSKYEGLFAQEPQSKKHDWMNGGSIEHHSSYIDGNRAVIKDAFGNVIRVESRW